MIRALALLLLLFSEPARAEQIIVRGGEHAGFTRLVLQVQAPSDWSVVPVLEGWDIRLGKAQANYETAPAWRLIRRDRLLDLLTEEDGSLRLVAGCDCHVRYWQFNHLPVIDLYDGPARPGTADVPRRTVPAPVPDPEARRPQPVTADDQRQALADSELGIAVDRAARGVDKRPVAGPETIAALAEARRRAAELEAMVREALEAPSEYGRTGSEDGGYELQPGSDAPLVVAGSDPGKIPADPAFGLTADGRVCPDPASVDPGLWAPAEAATPDFAMAKSGLFAEFDVIEPEATLSAARYYLYFGFGLEARQLLSLLPSDTAEEIQLVEIAQILDADSGSAAPTAPSLDGWESCDTISALWSLLAGPAPAQGDPIAANAVALAFQGLPAHLRQLLGPRLITIFLAVQDTDTADKLRNLMLLPDAIAPLMSLAAAAVEEALGAEAEARHIVDTALSPDKSPDPALLLKQAAHKIGLGNKLQDDLRDALEALAFEHRLQPLGTDIHKVLAENEILAGEFLAARQRLEDKLRAQDVSAQFHRLYLAAASQADGSTFLRLVLPEPRGLAATSRDTPVREALASRLTQLGFAAEALQVLGAPLSESGQIIAATAYLSSAQPDKALDALKDLSSPEAVPLRAASHAALGETDLAISLYRRAGLETEASLLALLRQDWAEAAAAETPFAEAATTLARDDQILSEDPYAIAQKLLEASANERSVFETLIAPLSN